jgi:hypothetical protein
LDEKIDTQEGIPLFDLCLRRFSKKEVSCVEEEDFPPVAFGLMNDRCFLGDTAKRTPESPTGFDLAHDIVCVDNAKLDFSGGLNKRSEK